MIIRYIFVPRVQMQTISGSHGFHISLLVNYEYEDSEDQVPIVKSWSGLLLVLTGVRLGVVRLDWRERERGWCNEKAR